MLSLNIEDIKTFMLHLLKEDTFDNFHVRNVEIITMNYFEIDGSINKNYYSHEEYDELNRTFSLWKEIKTIIYQIIKGKKLPLKLKIVLSIPNDIVDSISENAAAMFLNIIYENSVLLCTTGSSQKVFSLENREDVLCEDYFLKLFELHNIN